MVAQLPFILRQLRAHHKQRAAAAGQLADEPDDSSSMSLSASSNGMPTLARAPSPIAHSLATSPAPARAAPPSPPAPPRLVINSAPTSFLASQVARERRQRKLLLAKLRVKKLMGRCSPAMALAMGWTNVGAPQEDIKPDMNPAAEHLDDEDLLIQKLLLEGVHEDAILSGWYNATAASSQKHLPRISGERAQQLNAPELGEHDIAEEDLAQYILSDAEVAARRRQHDDHPDMENVSEPASKRMRAVE